MSSILTDAKGKLLAALFAIAAAIALTVAIAPASAYAATITIYDGDSTVAGTIDTTTVTKSDDFVYAQFCKNDVWNVVTGTKLVTLDSVLSSYFGSNWKTTTNYITFQTVDYPVLYNKYNSGTFTSSDFSTAVYFYGATEADSTLPLPTTITPVSFDAVLAFSWASAAQDEDNAEDTGEALESSVTLNTYPRLLWGFASASPSATGGNRFPADITAIHVY